VSAADFTPERIAELREDIATYIDLPGDEAIWAAELRAALDAIEELQAALAKATSTMEWVRSEFKEQREHGQRSGYQLGYAAALRDLRPPEPQPVQSKSEADFTPEKLAEIAADLMGPRH
jgi:flagellar biosynthesis/type III secretory pathway protein FliH